MVCQNREHAANYVPREQQCKLDNNISFSFKLGVEEGPEVDTE